MPTTSASAGDMTEHILWRLGNGELEGISPKVIVLMAARTTYGGDTPDDVTKGVLTLVDTIHSQTPMRRSCCSACLPRNDRESQPGFDKKNRRCQRTAGETRRPRSCPLPLFRRQVSRPGRQSRQRIPRRRPASHAARIRSVGQRGQAGDRRDAQVTPHGRVNQVAGRYFTPLPVPRERVGVRVIWWDRHSCLSLPE